MKGPAGVLALVLVETAAGGALFLWLAPLWGTVRRGFFVLTGAILAAIGLAAAGASAAAAPAGASRSPQLLALALTGATVLWTLLLGFRQDRVGRWIGLATVPLSLAAILAFAASGGGSRAATVFQLAAGTAFMGAVMDGLLLGHWYLVDRGLSRKPINFYAIALLVAVAFETVAVAMEGFGQIQAGSQFSSLLSAAGVASYLAVGMVLATGLIAVMIRLTLRGDRPSAVQAATGFFYLAVITAFAGELAAKIRFLPQA
ncbi:MAG: hypothetical protein LC722_08380 [Actinobacteria bacterium]|nr:hypothetical protein [Actinomycetota bacterium]